MAEADELCLIVPISVTHVWTKPTATRTHWGDDVTLRYATTVPTETKTGMLRLKLGRIGSGY